jgi:hypothetical protein
MEANVARRGIYRVRGKDGLPDDVRVEDDGLEVPVEESLYVKRGYLPLVTNLPWHDDYLADKASAESRRRAAEEPKRWTGTGRPSGGWMPDRQ